MQLPPLPDLLLLESRPVTLLGCLLSLSAVGKGVLRSCENDDARCMDSPGHPMEVMGKNRRRVAGPSEMVEGDQVLGSLSPAPLQELFSHLLRTGSLWLKGWWGIKSVTAARSWFQ